MTQLKNSTLSSGDIHSADTVISPGKCSPVLLLLINSFLYISVALYSPFLSAYYRQNGITSSQIGILMTVAPLASVIIQPFWAKRSDESGKAKKYVCAIILGIIVSLYTFYLGHSFTTFLIASILLALFSTSVNPMIDAIVIRNANYFQYNFATIRMGGTVGYAVIVLLVGVYLRKNPSAQFFLASIGYLILLLLLLRLPESENHQPIAIKKALPFWQQFKLSEIFVDKTIYFVLAFAFIYQLGASFLGSFLGVYTVELGYGQAQVGLLSCVQACSEIPVLLLIQKLSKKFGTLHLIAAATFLMGARLITASGGSLLFLILAQAMQGITYMIVHFCCATYIASHAKEGKASQGQSVLYIVQTGIASILGNILGGKIIDRIGIQFSYRYFGIVIFIIAAVIACCLFWREHSMQKSVISK